mmetsp:Transcript_26668/g.59822  ORF Transcript_26668/g.59822 Transcript_26668/m.59822 type:complete len:646 (+) Transcript_26668:240-2177(+)
MDYIPLPDIPEDRRVSKRDDQRYRKQFVSFGNPALGTYWGHFVTRHWKRRASRSGDEMDASTNAEDGSDTDKSTGSYDDDVSSSSSSSWSQSTIDSFTSCSTASGDGVSNIAAMVNVPPHHVPDGVLNLVRSHRPFIEHIRIVIGQSSSEESNRERQLQLRKNSGVVRQRSRTWAHENDGFADKPTSLIDQVAGRTLPRDRTDSFDNSGHEARRCVTQKEIEYNFFGDQSLGAEVDYDKRYHILFVMDSEESKNTFVSDLHCRPYTSLDENETCLVYDAVSVEGPVFAPEVTINGDGPISTNHGKDEHERQCPVCLEMLMRPSHESMSGSRGSMSTSSILTTVCNHSFHVDCIRRWQDTQLGSASCPVCRYDHAGLNETLSTCHVCSTTNRNYVCLICGVVSCANGPLSTAVATVDEIVDQTLREPTQLGHARRHYEETLHAYALDTETKHVWDFCGGGYVHRLMQNYDGKLVEGADPQNFAEENSAISFEALERSSVPSYSTSEDEATHRKLEAFAGQYSTLLKSQLEQQRCFYEGRLEALRREHGCGRNDDYRSTADLISALKQERNQLEQRCVTLRRKVKKIEDDTAFLVDMNESLEADKCDFRGQITEAQNSLAEAKKVTQQILAPLENKVTDLMLQLGSS